MRADQVKYIVIHCADTPPAMDIGAKEIDQWHREAPRFYSCIGYHAVIRRDGTVEPGRPLSRPGAHAHGYNSKSIGICLVGGKGADGAPENNFTPEQFAQLRILIQKYQQQFSGAVVLGHRDLPRVKKACPCFDVRAWLLADAIGGAMQNVNAGARQCAPTKGE